MKKSVLALGLMAMASPAFAATVPMQINPGLTALVMENKDASLNASTWVTFTMQAGTQYSFRAATASDDSCIELYQGDVTGFDFTSGYVNCQYESASFDSSSTHIPGSPLTLVAKNDDGFKFPGNFLDGILTGVAQTSGTYSLMLSENYNLYAVDATLNASFTPLAPVPVPASALLLMSAVGAGAALRRRRKA